MRTVGYKWFNNHVENFFTYYVTLREEVNLNYLLIIYTVKQTKMNRQIIFHCIFSLSLTKDKISFIIKNPKSNNNIKYFCKVFIKIFIIRFDTNE